MEDVLKRKNIQVKNIFRGKVLWLKVTAVFVMFIPGFVIVVLSFSFFCGKWCSKKRPAFWMVGCRNKVS